ncbi:hypothetical protein FHR33_006086 [Nonomuraea dietziae]|uniref:Uncharacterized protein n=1 Tax=Nonomuraea dietziae TaxID=65515 RepID=A0A7W5V8T1_9ACTN|nr:hypothetical protein [Nonomuraea dietziae]
MSHSAIGLSHPPSGARLHGVDRPRFWLLPAVLGLLLLIVVVGSLLT